MAWLGFVRELGFGVWSDAKGLGFDAYLGVVMALRRVMVEGT
jgi:hypothetical protein